MCTLLCNLFLLHLLFSSATAQPQDIGPPLPEDPSVNLTFDRTMTRLLVIVVVVIFLSGFISIYTRQCMERRATRRLNLTVPITNGSLCLPPRGLTRETIENFPNFVYSEVKDLKLGKVTLECVVCLNEFLDNDTLRLIPKCSHVFHRDCIDIWLVNHSTCPVCRADLLHKPDDVSSSIAIDINEPRDLRTNLPEPENNHNVNVFSRVDLDDCNRTTIATESSRVDLNEVNCQVQSKSTIARLFSRSHSMGQRDMDFERFTLRLPEGVQSRLVKSEMKSWSVTLASGRRGFRTRSVGRSYLRYERFDEENRLDRRGFIACTSSFLGRASSMRSNKDGNKAVVVVDEVDAGELSSDCLIYNQ